MRINRINRQARLHVSAVPVVADPDVHWPGPAAGGEGRP